MSKNKKDQKKTKNLWPSTNVKVMIQRQLENMLRKICMNLCLRRNSEIIKGTTHELHTMLLA